MARTAIHPDENLAEQIKELGMGAAEPGREIKMPTDRITGILNGQRAIAGCSAQRLAHFLRHQRGILAQSANVAARPALTSVRDLR